MEGLTHPVLYTHTHTNGKRSNKTTTMCHKYSIYFVVHSEAEEVEEIRKAQLFFRSLFTVSTMHPCPRISSVYVYRL